MYVQGNIKDRDNIREALKSLDFLENHFFEDFIERHTLQNFLRQSSILDYIMKLVFRLQDKSLKQADEEFMNPFFGKAIKILLMA